MSDAFERIEPGTPEWDTYDGNHIVRYGSPPPAFVNTTSRVSARSST